MDQFWWFFESGLALGVVFVLSKRLLPDIIIHWIVCGASLLSCCQWLVGQHP